MVQIRVLELEDGEDYSSTLFRVQKGKFTTHNNYIKPLFILISFLFYYISILSHDLTIYIYIYIHQDKKMLSS